MYITAWSSRQNNAGATGCMLQAIHIMDRRMVHRDDEQHELRDWQLSCSSGTVMESAYHSQKSQTVLGLKG